jgi:nucleotide-binding universal stress UspA family protein
MARRLRAPTVASMPTTVLVGFDDSPQARDALALALALSGETGEVVLCCVHPYQPVAAAVAGGEHDVPYREEAERRLDAGVDLAPDSARIRTLAVAATSAASGLHAMAEEEGADMLVAGSSHRGPIGRVGIGSTTAQALNAPPCAVAVTPSGLHAGDAVALHDVTVGFDGGPESREALRAGVALAHEHDARVRVVTVLEPVAGLGWSGALASPESGEDARAIAREQLDDATRSLERDVDLTTEIVEGMAAEELVRASSKTDLLVLGSRGYGPVRRALLGAVSARVVAAAAGPVLVLPRPDVAE